MLDGFGRTIDYLRISVTDRCDLRCAYCMPEEGVPSLRHEDILCYEDITRLARLFASLGIRKIRLTGGEPLVRKNLDHLVHALKNISGIDTVVLTTNGMLLAQQLHNLVAAGLDGVNISLDAVDEDVFQRITRRNGVQNVLHAVEMAANTPGLRVKLNCVPTQTNIDQLAPLSLLAGKYGIPLRFIELMPIGEGKAFQGLDEAAVKAILGPMTPALTTDAREKCRYYSLQNGASVGFISAMSHQFCHLCNRIRLTADGFLKTCLQYDRGAYLRPLLAQSDDTLRAAILHAVEAKPAAHHFGKDDETDDETRRMTQIGG